jgi:enoyl-CoA hydratase
MLNYSLENGVAVLAVDDGKANAVGHGFLDAVNDGLDKAESEAQAVLLTGRDGVFSAGFDLKEIQQGPEAAAALVNRGAQLMLRLFSYPLPVVAAASGHAIAAGAFILLAADTRIGAAGDFRIGLNETAIGMSLPVFALELSRERLSKRHQTASFIQAQLYDPEAAKQVGFLDEVVAPDQLLPTAMAQAAALGELPTEAYTANKLILRQAAIATIKDSIR